MARGITENIARVAKMIRGATDGTDVMVFPELFLTGYQTEDLTQLALSGDDAELEPLFDACAERNIALLAGFIERGDGGVYNSFLVIDETGRLVTTVKKTHLFGSERNVFLRGNDLRPFPLRGYQVGLINCFEVEFPEVARTLALRGAQVFLVGSANMAPYFEEHRIATTARVFENRIPLAYANRVGAESGNEFCGFSRIIAADGTVLQEAGPVGEAVLTAEVEISWGSPEETDMLSQRMPELYA